MKIAGRWGVALAVLPVVVGAAACGAGGSADPGAAVYGEPLAEQFHAATAATHEAGTSRFVSTVTWTTSEGKTVQHHSGTQDYAARTAGATLELQVPGGGDPGTKVLGGPSRKVMATAGDDVYLQREESGWLRFTPAALSALGSATDELTAHAAGEVAPFSGTLADLVPRTVPREEPRREKDGSRVYRVTALQQMAAELLPSSVPGVERWGDEQVPLTVRLDSEGRLSEVTADLKPLLDVMHDSGVMKEVTGLQASYRLSDFGAPVEHRTPGEDAEEAEKTVARLDALEAGACADLDTGMATREVVRTVGCAEPHDILVIAQVTVDEVVPGRKAEPGEHYAKEKCEAATAEAPESLLGEERRSGRVLAYAGSAQTGTQVGGGEVSTTVQGQYTCFVVDEGLTDR